MDAFRNFLGKNWFRECDAINAIASKRGMYTGLKVKGDRIHMAQTMLVDPPDIDVEDDRVTIVIDAEGKILQIYRG